MKTKNNYMDEEYEVVRDPKLAMLRILILISIILFIWFIINIITDNKDFIKNKASEEIIIEELEQPSVYPIKKNSKGDFISLNEKVFIEGYIDLVRKEDGIYIRFRSFKITNNPDIRLILSITPVAKATVEIGKLAGNIGNQEYKIPDKVDLTKHKYLIFYNTATRQPHAYADLSVEEVRSDT